MCRLRPLHVVAMILGMVAAFAAQAAWIKTTNFGGFDEWLIVRLVARGILDSPYSNRPFLFLWSWPSVLIAPHSFDGLVIVHYAYLIACGTFVFALCRRLAPGEPHLAFMAGTFLLVWTPMDFARYTPVQMTQSGFTFGMLFSLVLLLEAWVRGRPAFLALGALIAFVDVRSYEATLPILIAAPSLLLVVGADPRSSRFLRWTASWEASMALATLLVVLPSGQQQSYQRAVMGLDPAPAHVVARLVQQYGFHLLPLFFTPRNRLLVPAVPLVVGIFLLTGVLAARASRLSGARPEPATRLLVIAVCGFIGAGLGYSLMTLSSSVRTPTRTQFISGPGIAVLLASIVTLASRPLPARWRHEAATILAAWVVVVGTGRAVAIQDAWNHISYFPAQHRMLCGLTDQAPDLAPHTMLVLLDDGGAWPADFAFRSAIEYLYRGHALGFSWSVEPLLFPAQFTPAGLQTEPWASIRTAWACPVTLHRYDELVVVRFSASGEVRILDNWPEGVLPPLPPGARYAPWTRVLRGAPRPEEQRILDPRT